jgi:hypothetical protein
MAHHFPGEPLRGRAVDEAVMRVSATGLVTAIGAGNAVLSVESEGKQRTASRYSPGAG